MPSAAEVVDAARLAFVLNARPDLRVALVMALRPELDADPGARLAALASDEPDNLAALQLVIVGGYYTDRRVKELIGYNGQEAIEVKSWLLPEYHENQEGTYHFHHLMTVGEGCLTVSRSLDEHVAQLAAWARGVPTRSTRPFVERFIRPRGIATPATAAFVAAVETMGARPAPPPRRAPAWVYLLRPVVYALVLAGRIPFLERIYWNPAKFRQLASV